MSNQFKNPWDYRDTIWYNEEIEKWTDAQLNLEINSNVEVEFDKSNVIVWSLNSSKVSFGSKLIRLPIKSNRKVIVLYWSNGKFTYKKLNATDISRIPPNSTINLKQRLIAEIEFCLFKNNRDLNSISNSSIKTSFESLILKVTQFKNEIEQLNDELLIEKFTNITINPDSNDKLFILNHYKNLIFENYNPNYKSIDFRQTTLFCPLSIDFFLSDSKLYEYYELNFTNDWNLNRFIGGSGEGISSKEYINDFYQKIKKLQSFLENENIRTESSELIWLQSLTPDFINTIHRVIFISNETWHKDVNDVYAEFIGIANSLAWIKIPPILSVLIHEINVNNGTVSSGFLPQGDTHISPKDTEIILSKICKSHTYINQNVLADELDDLYQTSRNIELLCYAIIKDLF